MYSRINFFVYSGKLKEQERDIDTGTVKNLQVNIRTLDKPSSCSRLRMVESETTYEVRQETFLRNLHLTTSL